AALLPPPPPPLPPPDEPGLLGTVLQHQHVVRKRVRARQAMVGRIERATAWAEQELRHGEQWRIRLPAIAPTPAAEASASAFDPLALVLADRPATPRPRQPGSADAAEPS